MSGKPAARVTDSTAHGGQICTGDPTVLIGNKPAARVTDEHNCRPGHGNGPILPPCATNVLIGNKPAARVGDKHSCRCGHEDPIVTGDPTVLIGDTGGSGSGLASAAVLGEVLGRASKKDTSTEEERTSAEGEEGEGEEKEKKSGETKETQYSKGIVIKGDEEFTEKTKEDLDKIKSTPTGGKLIDSIDNSGKTVTIVEGSSNQARYNGLTGERTWTADTSRPPGSVRNVGSDVTVSYSPNDNVLYDGSEAWQNRPPAVGLAHELVHANNAAYGNMIPSYVLGVNPGYLDPVTGAESLASMDELATVGVAPSSYPYSYEFTENKIRAEWDPPQAQRPWY